MSKREELVCAIFALAVVGCGPQLPPIEGTQRGDCTDGADNDADGAFDCDDSSCAGSPACGLTILEDGGIRAPRETVFPERDYVCASGGTPCETIVPARTDTARTMIEPESMADTTLTFVVSTMALPRAEGGYAAGFNLDELDSGPGSEDSFADCEEFMPDYRSTSDPDHVGVDNAFQGLISTVEAFVPVEDCPGGVRAGCVDAMLQANIDQGESLLLIELRGVNDLTYDSDVEVQVYAGSMPAGVAPQLDAGGRLAPGQRFPAEPMGPPVRADIFAGRVRARFPSLALPGGLGELMLPLSVHDAEVRFDLATGRLDDGQIGGHLEIEELANAAQALGTDPATVRTVFEQYADIRPSAEDPQLCEAMSIGITFGATTATRQ